MRLFSSRILNLLMLPCCLMGYERYDEFSPWVQDAVAEYQLLHYTLDATQKILHYDIMHEANQSGYCFGITHSLFDDAIDLTFGTSCLQHNDHIYTVAPLFQLSYVRYLTSHNSTGFVSFGFAPFTLQEPEQQVLSLENALYEQSRRLTLTDRDYLSKTSCKFTPSIGWIFGRDFPLRTVFELHFDTCYVRPNSEDTPRGWLFTPYITLSIGTRIG